jgi:cytochrome c5
MNLKILVVAVAALAVGGAVMTAAPRSANAKPEYAAATGKPCSACHANPAGGGKLTGAGEKYKKTLK